MGRLSRRDFLIKGIGTAIIAGATPPLLIELLPKKEHIRYFYNFLAGAVPFPDGRLVSADGRPLSPWHFTELSRLHS